MKRLLFFPSWWLGFVVFPLAGRFFPLGDGILHGVKVEAVGFEHQFFRVQKFRLKPRPCCLFSSHAMVFEKATGRKGRGSENAHPADFFAANQRAQTKIQTDCYPYCKQGTDKLSGGKSKKDGLLIIPDFLWYFYFYIASLLSRPYRPNYSLTIRSLIRTAPTKTSKLKISSPT